MTTITQKRKELEKAFDINIHKNQYLNDTQIEWLKDRLKYFNLGVELQRKEFAEWLEENHIINEHHQNKLYKGCIFCDKIKELKSSEVKG